MKNIVLILTAVIVLSGCAPGVRSPHLNGGKGPARKQAKAKIGSVESNFKVEKLTINSGRDRRPITVKIRPRDAQVKLIAQAQGADIVNVNIKIADRRAAGGNPVIVFLEKPGYVRQQYFIYEPIKEATASLLRFSATKDDIKESFRRAARIYKLSMAYPAYLTPGLRLTKVLYEDNIPNGPSTRFLFLQWSGRRRGLLMQFLPQRGLQLGRPPEFEKAVKIDNNLEAKLVVGSESAQFFANGRKTSWYVSGQGLGRREFIKIIKSVRLTEE